MKNYSKDEITIEIMKWLVNTNKKYLYKKSYIDHQKGNCLIYCLRTSVYKVYTTLRKSFIMFFKCSVQCSTRCFMKWSMNWSMKCSSKCSMKSLKTWYMKRSIKCSIKFLWCVPWSVPWSFPQEGFSIKCSSEWPFSVQLSVPWSVL